MYRTLLRETLAADLPDDFKRAAEEDDTGDVQARRCPRVVLCVFYHRLRGVQRATRLSQVRGESVAGVKENAITVCCQIKKRSPCARCTRDACCCCCARVGGWLVWCRRSSRCRTSANRARTSRRTRPRRRRRRRRRRPRRTRSPRSPPRRSGSPCRVRIGSLMTCRVRIGSLMTYVVYGLGPFTTHA